MAVPGPPVPEPVSVHPLLRQPFVEDAPPRLPPWQPVWVGVVETDPRVGVVEDVADTGCVPRVEYHCQVVLRRPKDEGVGVGDEAPPPPVKKR